MSAFFSLTSGLVPMERLDRTDLARKHWTIGLSELLTLGLSDAFGDACHTFRQSQLNVSSVVHKTHNMNAW